MFQRTSIHSHNSHPSAFNSGGQYKTLAHSGFQLPLCWLMLFDESDLQLQKVFSHEGEQTCEYTTLICTKEQALQRYDALSERVKSLLGQRCDTYFDYWHQYLKNTADDYLHLDATALWMTGDEQAYLDNLRLSLSGLEWINSDECRWKRSWLESLPLIGRAFDPIEAALRNPGVKHLLSQCGVLEVSGDIYIDKRVLQGEV